MYSDKSVQPVTAKKGNVMFLHKRASCLFFAPKRNTIYWYRNSTECHVMYATKNVGFSKKTQ